MNVTLSADQPAGEAGVTQTGIPPGVAKEALLLSRDHVRHDQTPRKRADSVGAAPPHFSFSSRDRGPRDEKHALGREPRRAQFEGAQSAFGGSTVKMRFS